MKSSKECGDQSDAQGKLTKSGYQHGVAIKVYARVCDKKEKSCYDALQIQNSWSEQWQQENNDGWVDAKILLDRTTRIPSLGLS